MDNRNARLEHLSAIVTERIGLHYPDIRLSDLERGLASAAKSLGFDTTDACLAWLLEGPLDESRLAALVDNLTIGETYFFRHPETFTALEKHALPNAIALRRKAGASKRLSIWCAACSSGEEAYSIAIMLQRLLPDFETWDISLIATDINHQCLRKAASAEYSSWSFRGVSPDDKLRYFSQSPGGWTVKPGIRKAVQFEYLNLADGTIPATILNLTPIDVIFCRNVLIYFSPEHIRRLMGLFSSLLAQDGWLVTSPVETGYARNTAFSLKSFGNATLLQRAKLSEEGTNSYSSVVLPGWSRALHEPTMIGQAQHPIPPVSRREPTDIAVTATSALKRFSDVSPARVTIAESVEAPVDPIAHAARLHTERRYAEALKALHQISAESRVVDRSMLLARIHADLGNLDDALVWCRKALDVDVVRPDAHYLMATIQMAMGDDASAMESLRRVVVLDRDYAMAHYSLALLLRRLKRHSDSERHLQIVADILTTMASDALVAGSEGMSAQSMIDTVISLQQRRP